MPAPLFIRKTEGSTGGSDSNVLTLNIQVSAGANRCLVVGINYKDNSVDVILAFDVLTLIPDEMLKKLIKEMCRVCIKRIIIRTIIDYENERNGDWIGNDGVTFRYLTLNKWRKLFLDEKFYIKKFTMDYKREVNFVLEKIEGK